MNIEKLAPKGYQIFQRHVDTPTASYTLYRAARPGETREDAERIAKALNERFPRHHFVARK